MKILPISKSALTHKYFNTYDKNNHSNKNLNMLSFSSVTYSSGTYSDEEVYLAKKYIGKHNWQDEYREKRLEELMKDFNDKFAECIVYYWKLIKLTKPYYSSDYICSDIFFLIKKTEQSRSFLLAGDEARTRDILLGKQTFYH